MSQAATQPESESRVAGILGLLRAEARRFREAAEQVTMFVPRHVTQGPFAGKQLVVGGQRVIDLSGLDYLALGSDSRVKAILAESLARHDCGIPGSEAIIQTRQSQALEQALAAFHLGAGSAVTFTAGYGTNLSMMEALGLRARSRFVSMHAGTMTRPVSADVPTIFFMDSDLHFSARHGIRFARRLDPQACHAHTFRSGDHAQLEQLLAHSRKEHGERAVRIILTDTVESATGQEFDVGTLCRIAAAHDCLLYLDEAHAVGAVGPQGRGVAAKLPDFERHRERLLIMGTLTKVFCQPGGYVVMSDPDLAALLKFCSPQHVFSAPIAPWVCDALVHILALVSGDLGDQRRARVRQLSASAAQRLERAAFELVSRSETPILALPLRRPEVGTAVLEFMRAAGFLVSIFQGPLRPAGHEVVRLAMRADLDEADLDELVRALVACRETLRFTS